MYLKLVPKICYYFKKYESLCMQKLKKVKTKNCVSPLLVSYKKNPILNWGHRAKIFYVTIYVKHTVYLFIFMYNLINFGHCFLFIYLILLKKNKMFYTCTYILHPMLLCYITFIETNNFASRILTIESLTITKKVTYLFYYLNTFYLYMQNVNALINFGHFI